ncbi:MAG: hypothetical protein M1836_002758 [Candelina mexicana]|nr:MAG: hypothetical protein M1836_002758 [Candelina mexicana]
MAIPDPLENTFPTAPAPVSSKTCTIAGILTTVYGLYELQPSIKEVSCLWLLHPRLFTKSSMDPVAAAMIGDWYRRLHEGKVGQEHKGLIAVSFDQRNHGSRVVDSLRNNSWRDGNPTHAVDMFSTYHGTAMDTSLLLAYLSSHIFPQSEHIISTNIVLGVSLGGHAAWHCLLHDPNVSAAIVVVGCPDFATLMADRAARSKLQTWENSSPPGASFFGSTDYPQGLVDAVLKRDPAALLTEGCEHCLDGHTTPSKQEIRKLKPVIEKHLSGKRILNLAGGADKIVPYKCTESFMTWLKNATMEDGWFAHGACVVEDMVFDDVGHEMTPAMVREAMRFIRETLGDGLTNHDDSARTSERDSKM